MRLVYTADLHGDIASYQRLLELAIASDVQAVIVGGDLLPHAIRREHALDTQRSFLQHQLRPLLEAFHVRARQVAVFLLPGNDDWAAVVHDIDTFAELAYPLHEQVYDLAALGLSATPLWLAGYACVPLTPFSIKDYERRDDGPLPAFDFGMAYTSWSGAIQPASAARISALPSIAEALTALVGHCDPAHLIYVGHAPPYGTPLDAMPRGRHPGSRAVRTFIEQHQPLLTLHGHIHEAPQVSGCYAFRLGLTWAANPGHDQQHFSAITLDTDDIRGTITHTRFGGMQDSHQGSGVRF